MAIDLRDLERLIADKDFKGVRAELSVLQDADIALFMEELQREHVVMVFRSLPKDRAAEIFSYLSSDMQQYIVEAITDQEVSSIINDLYLDDAADFLEEMPA
ncbi:MAG: magnesium transporter, partial [Firmicutes bacterium]|nr:magnesium transporter [Bacillota bacterium]HBG09131.1 magnesium transporter [Bacillota bacterium]